MENDYVWARFDRKCNCCTMFGFYTGTRTIDSRESLFSNFLLLGCGWLLRYFCLLFYRDNFSLFLCSQCCNISRIACTRFVLNLRWGETGVDHQFVFFPSPRLSQMNTPRFASWRDYGVCWCVEPVGRVEFWGHRETIWILWASLLFAR